MQAELVFHRPQAGNEYRLRYLIEIDGRPVTPTLAAKSTVRVPVSEGSHVVRVYAGRLHCFEAEIQAFPGRPRGITVKNRSISAQPFLGAGWLRRPPILLDTESGEVVPGRVVRGRFR